MQRKRSSGERRADVQSAFGLLVYQICILVDKSFLSTLQKSFKEWNIFPQALVHCKWYFLNWPLQSTRFHKGRRNYGVCERSAERETRQRITILRYVRRYLYFWTMWFWFGSGLTQIRERHWRGWVFFFLFFKDLLHDCILTRQLLKCKHYQLSAAVSSGVVTNGLSLITVDQRTSNLSRMIIRCIQRMKQAYVHVLIFTELTLYVERSLGCFAFIKYKKGVLLFSWTQVSVLSPFCQSAPWKTQKAEIHQQLDTDLFCRVSHLTSVLDLWCVCFLMELNTRVCGGIFKKVQDDGAIYVHSFTQI